VLVVGVLALLAVPVAAHHTFSAYYIEKDTIEIEGEVIEFQYRNPHAWIHVQGRDLFGREARYAAEWVSTAQLERLDIDKKFFRIGDQVRIWGSPSRDPNENRIRLKRIERRSDGWKWGAGRETR
jgi:hypothetical protein